MSLLLLFKSGGYDRVAVASITEADDTVSSTGVLAIFGAASITEADDTVSATGTLLIQGVASITEDGDTVSSVIALVNSGCDGRHGSQ